MRSSPRLAEDSFVCGAYFLGHGEGRLGRTSALLSQSAPTQAQQRPSPISACSQAPKLVSRFSQPLSESCGKSGSLG